MCLTVMLGVQEKLPEITAAMASVLDRSLKSEPCQPKGPRRHGKRAVPRAGNLLQYCHETTQKRWTSRSVLGQITPRAGCQG